MAHVPIFQCKDTNNYGIINTFRLKKWHTCQLFSLKLCFTLTLLLGSSGDLIVLQIIHFLASLLSVGYFSLGTLANVAADIDDKDLICHVDFPKVHVIKHLFCTRSPHLFITGMPE